MSSKKHWLKFPPVPMSGKTAQLFAPQK